MFLAAALVCALRPNISLVPVASRSAIARAGSSYRASAHVSFSIHTFRAAKLTGDPGERAHVAGYYSIARRLLQSANAEGIGSSSAEALARLKRAVASLAHDANLEYARQRRVYDTLTENGRSQSQGPSFGFPGGPDARSYCP